MSQGRDPRTDPPPPDMVGDVFAFIVLPAEPYSTQVAASTVRAHPEWFRWWRPLNRPSPP